jgi:hypothetical protein
LTLIIITGFHLFFALFLLSLPAPLPAIEKDITIFGPLSLTFPVPLPFVDAFPSMTGSLLGFPPLPTVPLPSAFNGPLLSLSDFIQTTFYAIRPLFFFFAILYIVLHSLCVVYISFTFFRAQTFDCAPFLVYTVKSNRNRLHLMCSWISPRGMCAQVSYAALSPV